MFISPEYFLLLLKITRIRVYSRELYTDLQLAIDLEANP